MNMLQLQRVQVVYDTRVVLLWMIVSFIILVARSAASPDQCKWM